MNIELETPVSQPAVDYGDLRIPLFSVDASDPAGVESVTATFRRTHRLTDDAGNFAGWQDDPTSDLRPLVISDLGALAAGNPGLDNLRTTLIATIVQLAQAQNLLPPVSVSDAPTPAAALTADQAIAAIQTALANFNSYTDAEKMAIRKSVSAKIAR